jgi:MFS family permease
MTNPPSILRARVAAGTLFFAFGFGFAAWAARIPAIQAKLQLSAGELGTVLLGQPLGSILSLPVAGWLVARFGSRWLSLLSAASFGLLLPTIALAATPWQLALVLFGFGVLSDVLNIAVNTQAVAIEAAHGKPILSQFHGLFSLGTLAGAALAGPLIGWGVAPLGHFLGVGLAGVALALGAFPALFRRDLPHDPEKPLFALPEAGLWWLGLLGFCAMLAEGAMADWSSVYLVQTYQAEGALTTAGYTAFTLAMTLGRFSGDYLIQRFGVLRMLRGSGLLSAAGLALAVGLEHPAATIVGFAMVGAGLSTVVPMVYSAAGRSKVLHAGVAIAAVSTVSYAGFLIGPPIIGWGANLASLRLSLLLVMALGLVTAWFAKKAVGQ